MAARASPDVVSAFSPPSTNRRNAWSRTAFWRGENSCAVIGSEAKSFSLQGLD
ncbi:hypothetical protein L904_08030 [Agrobacterium sp. LY4]|nr:hypothetical protein L904_08030 [Agrobacterium sp. LY4]